MLQLIWCLINASLAYFGFVPIVANLAVLIRLTWVPDSRQPPGTLVLAAAGCHLVPLCWQPLAATWYLLFWQPRL